MGAEDAEQQQGAAPAAPGSPLASIRDRRAKVQAQLHRDLAVPRYDPPIYVRFRPLTQTELDNAQKTHEKSRDREKTVIINAGLLANACVGVFEVVGGQEVSVDPADRDGDWPRFDEQLARLVTDVPVTKASEIVRQLYLTDGDIIATAGRLTEWSGYTEDELERDDQGN